MEVQAKHIGTETDKDRVFILDKYRDGSIHMGPGEFVVMEKSIGGNFGQIDDLFIACPKCGVGSFTGKAFSGNRQITQSEKGFSSTPSLIFMCCGWHGWLTDNIFHLEKK